MTGVHLLISASTNFLCSAGFTRLSVTITAPSASSRLWKSASLSAVFSAVLILSSTALGVPLGAYMPCQIDTLKPFTPDSSSVGSLASEPPRRLGVETAKALTLPPSICEVVLVVWSHMMSTWPPIRSVMAGPVPL